MEQRIVPFQGDELVALRDAAGKLWAPLKPMCAGLGIADNRQARRLRAEPWATTTMTVAVGKDGRRREMFCITVETVPMWLATIHASRVRADLREKLVRYQLEARDVLARAFLPPEAVGPSTTDESLLHRLADRIGWGFLNGAVRQVFAEFAGLREGVTGVRDAVAGLRRVVERVEQEVVKVRRRQAAGGRGAAGLTRRDRKPRPRRAGKGAGASDPQALPPAAPSLFPTSGGRA